MAAPLGPRYFKAESVKNGLMIQEIQLKETPFIKLGSRYRKEPPKVRFDKSKLTPDWIEKMSWSQQRASNTLEVESEIDSGLLSANTLMFNALKTDQMLTSEFIEKINFQVQKKVVGSGVIRGTEARVVTYPDGNYLVDLKKTEMKNFPPFEFWYLPASEVSSRITQWLKEANLVGPKTTLMEIANLYQQFIIIHPFSDGNGRTSTVILDYLLTKAGFPPLLHNQDTRQVIFNSVKDLSSSMIDAMAPLN
jgi:hypothetical protein